jgi:hypothetical protein
MAIDPERIGAQPQGARLMHIARKTLLAGALLGAAIGGGAVGVTMIGAAGAQEATTTTSSTASSTAGTPAPAATPPTGGTPDAPDATPRDPSLGGHVGANGTVEVLLTGDVAEKVKAAALAAVPGGTIQRVENDAEGAVYEAHMLDASGNQVTVKLDANFVVTGTESGRH